MKKTSRSAVFVNTDSEEERVAVLKTKDQLAKKDTDDEDIFQTSLVDRYRLRPNTLECLSLADFAANYTTDYSAASNVSDCVPNILNDGDNQEEDEEDANDQNPPSARDTYPKKITLKDEKGHMHRRRKEAIIRFRKISKEKEPENHYRAKLMLYLPWRREDRDLLAGYNTYQEHYEQVEDEVSSNEEKYTSVFEAITEAINDNAENGNPEHVWAQIAPGTEHANRQDLEEGPQINTELDQQDLNANAELFEGRSNSDMTDLLIRYERNDTGVLSSTEYREMMRQLNTKQRELVMFHRQWCKEAVALLKVGKKTESVSNFPSRARWRGKVSCDSSYQV